MIVAVEGPSAAGKTTWCRRVADRFVPEYVPTGREPDGSDPRAQGRYWTGVNTRRWSEAVELESALGYVLCDSDPLKLHYSWCLYRIGAAPRARFVHEYQQVRQAMRHRRLGFADAVLVALPDETTLRQRKEGDATRARRSFDLHVQLRTPLQDWYRVLADLSPGRVAWNLPQTWPSLVNDVPVRAERCDIELLDTLVHRLPVR